MGEVISVNAAAAGIKSIADAKRVFVHQAPTWWLGTKYHCPICAREFRRADDAAEHLLQHGHPVLRADAPPFVGQTEDRLAAAHAE